jgi:hypothetical protein
MPLPAAATSYGKLAPGDRSRPARVADGQTQLALGFAATAAQMVMQMLKPNVRMDAGLNGRAGHFGNMAALILKAIGWLGGSAELLAKS